jgi:predicted dehydrogenase
MQRVKTAIVGLGYWGPNLVRNFSAESACELVWGCDKSEERLNWLKSHYPAVRATANFDDILNDPSIDLVLIATPTTTHAALASKALEAGKHVFVEKPLTPTSTEAKTLVSLAEAKGKLLFVDHTFLFAPAVEKMIEMAEQKKLGDLLYFDSVRINLGLIQQDTTVLWDLAIHDLSILAGIKDLAKVVSVAAIGSSHFGKQTENAHIHLLFDDGFNAHIHVSWLSPVKVRRTTLAGTSAMLVYDDTEPSEKLRLYDSGVVHDATRPDPMLPTYRVGDILIPALDRKETLAREAEHVLACVQGKEKPRSPGAQGLQMLTILEAAHASLDNGGAAVPPVR